MKIFKSGISIMLALLMLLSLVPLSSLSVAAADDYEDDTDINIPIVLGGAKQTRGQAIADTLNYRDTTNVVWKHPDSTADLEKLLTSKKDEDKYISLTKDLSAKWKHSAMETYLITRDKVFDLNGHSIDYHVDSIVRPWSKAGIEQSPYQREDKEHLMNTAMRIEEGATLTIIDSSMKSSVNGDKGTGKIEINGYMVNPYKHDINNFANFELFDVSHGNLVIYGGKFIAGRSKAQFKSKWSWSKFKTVIGQAVELGVNVAAYATGIDAAVASKNDVLDTFKKLADETDTQSSNTKKSTTEEKSKNPDGGEDLKTVGEKQDGIDNPKPDSDGNKPDKKKNSSENGENKPNDNKSAKSDKNTKIADANKKIVDSVLDKDGIKGMVDTAFAFAEGIGDLIGDDQNSRVIQTQFGTPVKVGNLGTFVSYGGEYIGYGSSPNTRNAVVEVTRAVGAQKNEKTGKYPGGLAYIYGGNFTARAGANVFNIVTNNSGQTMTQTRSDDKGNRTTEQVKIKEPESMGLEELKYESNKITPVDTSNITVRGGSFKTFYELKNVGLKTSDDSKFSTFIGTSGSVNLGITSFDEDFIKDGRIQINDTYGEGALVLMDENRTENNELYHYRLFCSDMELRYKQGLDVYPNTARANTTHSFELKTQLNGGDTVGLDEVFKDDDENARGAYSTTEKLFYFPINTEQTKGYTIKPTFKNLDPDAENMEGSPTWYYQTPIDADGRMIKPLELSDSYVRGTLKSQTLSDFGINDPKKVYNNFFSVFNTYVTTFGGNTYVDGRTIGDLSVTVGGQTLNFDFNNSKSMKGLFDDYKIGTHTYNYLSNLKWFEYKIYRVDPLTRLNVGKDGKIGDDQPIAEGVYGSEAKKGMKTMIRLTDLEKKIKAQNKDWTGYKQGEMYRITLSVEERLNYNYYGYKQYKDNTSISEANGDDTDEYAYTTDVGTAKAKSSILFMCYGADEKKNNENYGKSGRTSDFTPLQWEGEPTLGKELKINFVNAKTGNVDFETTRIFDVYYQWWTVDDNGNKKDLIAGTNNVWDISKRYKEGKAQGFNDNTMRELLNKGKEDHTYSNWLRGKDNFKYANILAPDDPLRNELDWNGKKVVYDEDDLPKIEYEPNGEVKTGTNKWPKSEDASAKLIHAYSHQWMNDDDLKENKNYNLSNKNNNLDYGNSDSLYIPKSLGGKKIMVKAVAVNVNWSDYYDVVQTFYSHTIQLPDREFDHPVSCTLDVKKKNNYISIDNEAEIKVGSVSGLDDDEYVNNVYYSVYSGEKYIGSKSFDLKKGDEIPSVKFPSDFYDEKHLQKGRGYAAVSARDLTFNATVKTNLNAGKAERKADAEPVYEKYEVEAESYRMLKDSYEYDLEDIKSGKVSSGEQKLISVLPLNTTVGVYYDSAKSTDKDVAYIDENGMLAFGGKAGKATLSLTGPDGETVSTLINVIDYVDDVEISNINPPEIGKTFQTDVTLPEGADYKLKDVYWTDGEGNRMNKDDVAKNYRVYTINMVVEKAAPDLVFRKAQGTYLDFHPFTLYMKDVNGENLSVTNRIENGKFDYTENEATGDYEIGDTCTYSYTYKSSIGEADTTINKIKLDFPTEVREGDSVDEWMENFTAATNGDDSQFKFYPGFVMTSYAEQTLEAYGYKINLANSQDTMKSFIKGTIDGPMMKIDLVWKDKVNFADKKEIDIRINGETNPNATLDITSETTATITVPNALTILEGHTIPGLPKYTVKDFNLAVDETVKLDSLLSTEGNIRLEADIAQMNDIAEYVEYDDAANTLTGIKASSEALKLPLYVTVPGADGETAMRVSETRSKKVYAKASDCPAVDDGVDMDITVKALKPDGTTAYEKSVKAHKATADSEWASFAIDEIDGALITKLERDREGNFKFDISGGADRLSAYLKDGDTITVYTVAADSMTVNASPTELYPQFKDIDKLCVSLDGDHWTTSKLALVNLEADKEYMLYYKQGVDGTVYTKVVKTLPESDKAYIYVGRKPVTKSEPGVLERDGYHYDIETKTLTLKNLDIADMGVDSFSAKLFDVINLRFQSVIFSPDDLTINLIGDNVVRKVGGESTFLLDNAISCQGNLTITGEGNLTVYGNGTLTQGISVGKDLTLEGTGKIYFKNLSYGFSTTDNAKVNYKNGELLIDPYTTTVTLSGKTHNVYGTQAIFMDDADLDFSKSVHTVKYYTLPGDALEVEGYKLTFDEKTTASQWFTDNDYSTSSANNAMHIVPNHSFTQKAETIDYYVSGDCSEGATYYMSCSCGAADHEHTFTSEPGGHELIDHEGKAETCLEDGYKAYHTCAKCGYTDFETVPAHGHKYVHHDEVLPDCDHDGCPAYDECSVCGYSSLNKSIKLSIEQNSGDTPSNPDEQSGIIERNDLWAATGHDLIAVPEVACTCDKNGVQAHFKCAHCDKLYADEAASKEVTEADLVIEAEHSWGYWTVTKEPTETEKGVETRVCLRDPSHKETRDVPVLGHVHNLTLVPAKDATDTENGNLAYYTCDGCDYWFEDAEGTKIIDDKDKYIIKAKNPKPTETPTDPSGDTPTEPITDPDAPPSTDPGAQPTTQPVATEPGAESPTITPASVKLKAGKTKTLTVSGDAVTKWVTSDKKVAKVSKKGVVTALKKGKANISAILKSGQALICKVTVSSSPTIKINGKKFSAKKTYAVKKGKKLTIAITGKASAVKNSYKTSAKKIAKITSKKTAKKLKLAGLKKGKATVTLKVNGVSFKIKVKVK